MALSKIIAEGVDLTDTFAFTGTVTGAGLTSPFANTVTVTSEGGAVTTNLAQGLAKAWVAQLDGGGGTNDSFNFASFTDNGDNNTATFTNSMGANYSTTVAADEPQSTAIDRYVSVFARSASSFKMKTFTSSGGASSVPQNAVIHGDLA